MAVNQVSLFFYPPRWRQRLTTPNPAALTDRGTPVQVAGAEPVTGADGPAVTTTAMKAWLADRGFAQVEWGVTFQRGQVRSIFGPEKEIEVCVGDESGEVTGLYIRFTLPRREHPPLPAWAGFATELCSRFQLRLGAEGIAPCGEAEFLAAVRGHRFFLEFAASFGWPRGAEPDGTLPGGDS